MILNSVDLPEPECPTIDKKFPALHFEIHTAQRMDIDVADVIGLAQIAHRNNRITHTRAPRSCPAAQPSFPDRPRPT